ncbi:hypothetical protein ACIP93_33660 [Streptomyces sp. NPDC088745]|uniref:hypothetical protein n=1 Tax=Streptomyces sp. NPDC088745 TaxID=3365884 RepID=UPI0037F52FFA
MILLTGQWDPWNDNLVVTASYTLADDDDASVARLVARLPNYNGWAASFLVDDHKRAVQEAYETYVAVEDGAELVDAVHGVEPRTG